MKNPSNNNNKPLLKRYKNNKEKDKNYQKLKSTINTLTKLENKSNTYFIYNRKEYQKKDYL